MPETIKLGPQYRAATITRADINEEDRTVKLAFSSEAPYERYWGVEVLGHSRGEVDLSWLETGQAPLLMDHNPRDQVGIIEEVSIGADRKGRAVVRFGKGTRADEIFRDVLDGIRLNVSVGYEINKLQLVEENKDAPSIYRVTDWRPLEISIVSIPADPTVGVGREADTVNVQSVTIERKAPMSEVTTATAPAATAQATVTVDVEAIRAEARKNEESRVREIISVGERFNCRDKANEAIKSGKSADLFKGEVLMSLGDQANAILLKQHEIGLSEKEAKRYSLTRAIASMMDPKSAGRGAEFEMECSAAVAKRTGAAPKGFFVPVDYQARADIQRRDLLVGTATAGGNAVATDLDSSSFIDLLRNRMMVRAMGARVLSGLQGNLAIPKLTGSSTAYWVAENNAPTEGQQTIGQVTMSPKTIAAFTDFSRQLMLQSSLDVESLVRSDLSQILALGIDLAALHGTGSNNQPKGVANITGIGSVVGGDNGAAPTWGNIVDLETEVAVDNADLGSLGYLTNAKMRGKLKQTQKAANTGMFVWENNPADQGFGMMNGYRAGASNQVSSALTKGTANGVCSAIFFGNWADLIIGEWGMLDILVDPYTGSSAGTVRVTAFQSVDVAVRRAESFAAMLDALSS
ncbi:putative Phage major capsid protein, HK97 family [Magnetospirillum sp. XM-1]|uniref:phage major capsid protein n=1 Tax=Magnetospirillum sp. XM-1 TaxID=1663591 RepID=UPI00073DEADC|nr:phage major capsid protein [Magnetospirillum sp. XM-1]CUW39680.1 putative Phage major capsid protein, HK97 family [Magnetospirillum sp. XM-1]